jgi:hypothetical protein
VSSYKEGANTDSKIVANPLFGYTQKNIDERFVINYF